MNSFFRSGLGPGSFPVVAGLCGARNHLAAVDSDGAIMLWDTNLAGGRPVAYLHHPHSVISCGVEIAAEEEEDAVAEPQRLDESRVAFSATHSRLFSLSSDGNVHVWHL